MTLILIWCCWRSTKGFIGVDGAWGEEACDGVGGAGPPAPPALLRLAAAIDELELILIIIYTKNEYSNRISPKIISLFIFVC